MPQKIISEGQCSLNYTVISRGSNLTRTLHSGRNTITQHVCGKCGSKMIQDVVTVSSKARHCGSYCTLTCVLVCSERLLVCKLSLAANLLPGANLYPVQHACALAGVCLCRFLCCGAQPGWVDQWCTLNLGRY